MEDYRHLTGEAKDLAYMRNPAHWSGMLCPLKHRTEREPLTGMPLLGYLDSAAPVVKLGTIFAASSNDEEVRYNTHDELVKYWKVD